jgi:hypothetical protein
MGKLHHNKGEMSHPLSNTRSVSSPQVRPGRPRKDVSAWIVRQYGDVDPATAYQADFDCVGCGNEATLPVMGRPLAQLGPGIVFDIGTRAMPAEIQCPKCMRVFSLGVDV